MNLQRRKSTSPNSYQLLERRQLLAGGVQVSFSDSVLTVIGDELDNQIAVTQNQAGAIVVTGVNTTVNGSSTPFVDNNGANYLTLLMEGGNDTVTMTDVSLRRSLSYYGGEGSDRLETVNSFARHLHAEGNAGDDVFELGLSTSKSAYLYLGDGDDVVAINSLTVGKNFKVFGGNGNDTFASRDMSVRRKMSLNLDNGNDNLLIAGTTNLGKKATARTGDGNDFVAILPATNSATAEFPKKSRIDTGSGDDSVLLDAGVNVSRRARVDGGSGTDAISNNASTTNRIGTRGFENISVANRQSLLDAVFARLEQFGIDAVPFGKPSAATTVSVTSSAGSVSFTENGTPVVVDSGLVLNGQGITAASQATVSVGSFQAGQDTLAFNTTLVPALNGSFNSTSGVLTITGAGTLVEYQSVLRSVTYVNNSENPSTANRSIQFTVTADGKTGSATRNVTIAAVNDAPVITLQETQRSFSQTDLPLLVDGGIVVSDVDNTQLANVVVAFTTGYINNQDRMTFTSQSGIIGTFDDSTGALTLSGAGGAAVELTSYQTLLRTIRYSNASTSPTLGNRTLRFTVNDGLASASDEIQLQFVGT